MDVEKFLKEGILIDNPALKSESLTKKQKKLLPKTIISNDPVDAQDYANDVANIFGEKNYGLTHLDIETLSERNIAPNPVNTEEELNKLAATRQGNLTQFGNALVQAIGGEAVIGTMIGTADLLQFFVDQTMTKAGVWDEDDTNYRNAVSEAGEKWKEELREFAPILRENPYKPFDTGDWAWWMDNAVSMATTISLAIPGGIASKGISSLSRLLGLNKGTAKILKAVSANGKLFNPFRTTVKAGDIAETGVHSALMRITENYAEGRQTYDNVYNNTKSALDDMTDEQRADFIARNPQYDGLDNDTIAKNMAKEGADQTFKDDMWLTLFDFAQLRGINKIWKGGKRTSPSTFNTREAERQLKATIEGTAFTPKTGFNKFIDKVKHVDKKIALAELSEAPEEMWQSASQEHAIDIAKLKLNPKEGVRSYSDLLTDSHTLEAGFWGWLGGLSFQGAGAGVGKAYNEYQDYKWQQEHANDPDIIKNYNARRQEKILERMRVQEIQSRIANFTQYNTNMDLINQGYNPYKSQTNERGEQEYEYLEEEDKEYLKQIATDEFLTNLTINAVDRGNFDGLLALAQSPKFAETLGRNIPTGEDTNRSANIAKRIKEIADIYEYELGNVASSATHEYAVRNIAALNTRNRLGLQHMQNEEAKIAGDLSKAVGELNADEQAKVNKLINYINEEAIANAILNINETIAQGVDSQTKRELERKRAILLKELTKYKVLLRNPETGEDTFNHNAQEELDNEYRAIGNLAAQAANAKVNKMLQEGTIIRTNKQIQEASKFYANLNEKYRKNEYDAAYKEINRLLKRNDVDLEDLLGYVVRNDDSLNDNEIYNTLRKRFDDLEIFSSDAQPVRDDIIKMIQKENARRGRAAKAVTESESTDVNIVPETLNPDPIEDETEADPSDPSSTGEQPRTVNRNIEEELGEAIRQKAVNDITPSVAEQEALDAIGKEVIEIPDDATNAAIESQADAYKREADQANTIKKNITQWGKGKSEEYWKTATREQVINDVIAEAKKTTTNPNILNDIRNEYWRLLTNIAARSVGITDSFDISQIPFIQEELNIRSSSIILESDVRFEINKGVKDREANKNNIVNIVKSLIEEYAKAVGLTTESINYSSINSIIKFAIHNNVKDINSLINIYNGIIEYINTENYKNQNFKVIINKINLTKDDLRRMIEEVEAAPNESYNSVSVPIKEDTRIQLNIENFNDMVNKGKLNPNSTIIVRRADNKTLTYHVIDENNNYVQIGSARLFDELNNGGFRQVRVIPHELESTVVNLDIRLNGTVYESNLDNFMRSLYKPKTESDKEMRELVLKYIAEGKLTEEEYTKLRTNESYDKGINKSGYRNQGAATIENMYNDNTSVKGVLKSLVNIIRYDFTDDASANLVSYMNYVERLYNNALNIKEQSKNLNSEGLGVATVKRLSYGSLITDGELKPIDEAIVDFKRNRENIYIGVFSDTGVTTERGVTTSIKGLGRMTTDKGRVGDTPVLIYNNGNSAPSVAALYSNSIGSEDGEEKSDFYKAVQSELADLLMQYQRDQITFDKLYENIADIFGINKLVSDIRLYKVEDENPRIILSISPFYVDEVYSQNANITIFKNNTSTEQNIANKINGGINLYYNSELDNGASEGRSAYNWSNNDFYEVAGYLLDHARFAVSRDYTTNKVNTNYVTKNNGKFTIKIGKLTGGFEKTYNSYLDYLIDVGAVQVTIGQENGSNFTTNPNNPRQNKILQVGNVYDPDLLSKEGQESLLKQRINNEIKNRLQNSKIRRESINDAVQRFAPDYKRLLSSENKVDGISILPDVIYYDLFNSDGTALETDEYASYDPKTDSITVYRKLLEHLQNNPVNNQTDFITRLIHENVHKQFAKRNYEDIKSIQDEMNNFAKELYNELFNTDIVATAHPIYQPILKQLQQIFSINNYDVEKGFTTIADLEEFITETITQPQFTQLLGELQYRTPVEEGAADTFWSKFVKLICNLFNIPIDKGSYLAREIQILNNINKSIPKSTDRELKDNNKEFKDAVDEGKRILGDRRIRNGGNRPGSRFDNRRSMIVVPQITSFRQGMNTSERAEFDTMLRDGRIKIYC